VEFEIIKKTGLHIEKTNCSKLKKELLEAKWEMVGEGIEEGDVQRVVILSLLPLIRLVK